MEEGDSGKGCTRGSWVYGFEGERQVKAVYKVERTGGKLMSEGYIR